MNIHPAFVHFPIALLFLYALIEVLPLKRWLPNTAWDSVRAVMLYLGTVAAIITAGTGLLAENVTGETPAVSMHENFAVVLIVLALIASAISYFWREKPQSRLMLKALAILIFVDLFVVGALGANIVYGKDVDPIVSFVVNLLGVR